MIMRVAERLSSLNLRDRWGYALSQDRLIELAYWIQQNPGADEDALAIAMLTDDVPMVCEGSDTPAGDELIRTIIQTAVLELIQNQGEAASV